VCRAEGIDFTAIVRSRPERITDLPERSRVVVVESLSDGAALADAFSGADAVLTALGVTATTQDRNALLSANMITVKEAMIAAGVDRILIINTLLSSLPGMPASRLMRFFSWMPGNIGRGAAEQQAVVDALGKGVFQSLRWTLVRAAVNSRGSAEPPVASTDWQDALNSWLPVSYEDMARWMLEESAANDFVRAAPLVSRMRKRINRVYEATALAHEESRTMWITRISDHSTIPFEEFMRRALHDSQHGYYARRIRGVGRRGDFTTAPMLSEALASAIAAWAARAMRETGCRDLIEIGPGEGKLAAAVMKHLPWRIRWRARLHLVESSAPLAEIQKEQLGSRARWHDSPTAALAACNGQAVIFSNELVDAFPVRLFENHSDGWREIAVSSDAESLLPTAALPPSSGFSADHPNGQRVEVYDSYRRWLNDWLPLWKAGRMLTIDYGAPAEMLYQRRPRGTLRAYLFHQRLEGPAIYQNPGRQDITADVNFSDLVDWSAPWTTDVKLMTMAEFIGPGDADLSDPQGAGGAFMVLDQRCRNQP
jgi:SAM-dependent MidA family methyltransferase/putative NADH-flavin reductase